jgi:hypothetical protein
LNQGPTVKKYLLTGCLLSLSVNALAQPDALSVSIGTSKDNTMYNDPEEEKSNALGQHFFVGATGALELRRGLIAFDVSCGIPAGSRIADVLMTLHVSRASGTLASVDLHRALSDWGEGTSEAEGEEGDGAPATPGDATWLHSFFDTDLWSNPGGDFAPEASATLEVLGEGFYEWHATPRMLADVQAWLDAPETNFGWILVSQQEATPGSAKRFDTKENADPDLRPILHIVYTTP